MQFDTDGFRNQGLQLDFNPGSLLLMLSSAWAADDDGRKAVSGVFSISKPGSDLCGDVHLTILVFSYRVLLCQEFPPDYNRKERL